MISLCILWLRKNGQAKIANGISFMVFCSVMIFTFYFLTLKAWMSLVGLVSLGFIFPLVMVHNRRHEALCFCFDTLCNCVSDTPEEIECASVHSIDHVQSLNFLNIIKITLYYMNLVGRIVALSFIKFSYSLQKNHIPHNHINYQHLKNEVH